MGDIKEVLNNANSKHIDFVINSDIEYNGINVLEAMMYSSVVTLNNVFLSNLELAQ